MPFYLLRTPRNSRRQSLGEAEDARRCAQTDRHLNACARAKAPCYTLVGHSCQSGGQAPSRVESILGAVAPKALRMKSNEPDAQALEDLPENGCQARMRTTSHASGLDFGEDPDQTRSGLAPSVFRDLDRGQPEFVSARVLRVRSCVCAP